MTRALATITTFSSTRISGHVAFLRNPGHRPVLHLCNQWRLVGSRMASARLHQLDDEWFVREFAFDAEAMGVTRFSADDVTIVLAETGERLVEPRRGTGELKVEEILQRDAGSSQGAGRTYEDALLYGYCTQEIVSLMFRDYLGRPCDETAMRGWEKALDTQSTLTDLVEALIASPEYAERRLNIGSLPGTIFDNALLYMADTARMKDLQDVSYATPQHDAVIDLRPLASGDNEEFVETVFRTLLMRPVDPDARPHFIHCLNHGWSRRDIAAGLVASPEFNTRLLVGGFHALEQVAGSVSSEVI